MRHVAAVMIIAAASVITGCTTVARQPAPEPSSAPAVPVFPFPLPQDRTVVQQPDHQTLATVRPEPASDLPASAAPQPEAAPRHHRARTPAAPARPGPAPAAKAAPHHPRAAASLPGGAGVCALGETYGGWARNSDAARICHESYGR